MVHSFERYLVNSELLHLLDNRAFPGGSNILAWGGFVCDTIDVERQLTEDSLRTAFKLLQSRHPHLRCCVKWDASRKRASLFKALGSIDPALLEFQDSTSCPSNDPRHMLNKLFLLEFGENCAQIGIGVFKSGDLTKQSNVVAVVAGHAIADLISVTVLLKELMYFISVATNLTPVEDATTYLPAQHLPVSILQLIPANQRGFLRFLFRGGVRSIKSLLRDNKVNRALRCDMIPASERTGGEPFGLTFTEVDTRNLLTACKKNGVSVHSVLSTALYFAHRIYLTQNETRKATVTGVSRSGTVVVPIISTVDVRRRAIPPLPSCVVGSFAYSVATKLAMVLQRTTAEAMTDDFWTVTRDFHTLIQTKLEQKEHWWLGSMFDGLIPTGLLASKFVSMVETFQDQVIAPLSIGNVGVVEPLECKGFKLENMHVEFNNSSSGFYLCAVTYRNQLSLSSHSQCFSKDTLSEMIYLIQDVLLKLAC